MASGLINGGVSVNGGVPVTGTTANISNENQPSPATSIVQASMDHNHPMYLSSTD
ncbi:hypothetical protein HAX54_027642, partial [Datura stramonium]|nr:hypothetical protein [Datura stramonium]